MMLSSASPHKYRPSNLPLIRPSRVRDLAYTTPALFISPAYRLIPESRAVDALDDVGDFWTWLHAHLPATISAHWPHLTADLGHIAAVGESAGGYLAMQSALLFSRTAKLRAAIAQYPGLYPDLTGFADRPKTADPKFDALVAEYVKNTAPGAIRVSSPWPEKVELFGAVMSNGLLAQVYGEDKEGRLTLGYALARAEEVPPPVWVIQGDDDHLVSKAWTDEVVERIRKEKPRATIKYTVQPGDHGFDGLSRLDDDWVKEGVDFVKGYWL
jgi:acetyl esterase/lipase